MYKYVVFSTVIVLIFISISFIYLLYGFYIESLLFLTLPIIIVFHYINYDPQYYIKFD